MTANLVDGLEQSLRATLQSLAHGSRSAAAQRILELALATSYASAAGDPAGLARLEAILDGHSGLHPALLPWLELIRLARAPAPLEDLPGRVAFARSPPFSTFVAGAELARLIWYVRGPRLAWRWLASLEPLAPAAALDPVDELQRDNPLLVSACCTLLDLSAANGAWREHQALFDSGCAWWATDSPQAIRVALAHADACLVRGYYARALRVMRERCASARGDLRVKQLATTLQALIGLGRAGSAEAASIVSEYVRTDGQETAGEWRTGPLELERCRRLINSLVTLHDSLAKHARDAGVDTIGASAATAPETEVLLLLEAERSARQRNITPRNAPARRGELLALTKRAEELMQRAAVWSDPGLSIRVRLSWCRLVADTAPDGALDACWHVLDGVLDETKELGLAPLQMRALEQRASLCSRLSAGNWQTAVLDGTQAARIALELLAANAEGFGDANNPDRSLLESLLPVFDRVIQTYVEGASSIAQHDNRLAQPCIPLDERGWNDESVRGSWIRFGRLLHGFAEKEQTLALEEARRSYADNRTVPMRFITVPEAPSTLPLEEIRQMLPPCDAILQYFMVGPYLLGFVYGRYFFEWCIRPFAGDVTAEQAIKSSVQQASAWTRGMEHASEREVTRALQSMLLPDEFDAALRLAAIEHLRIVPHGALYRIPFGRLAPGGKPLIERHSMSLHVTSKLAAKSAARPASSFARGRRMLAYVSGPEPPGIADGPPGTEGTHTPARQRVACAGAEEQALREGLGRYASLSGVECVDATTQPLEGVIARLESAEHCILHFTCHGSEGGPHGQIPKLLIGCDGAAGLGAPRISTLRLEACWLVFLQSCSTGWMDHERSNPVQGIPQAFLDAGARAVIAPLCMVPMALAAPFSAVFYRALRFLSPECALARTLGVFRAYGRLLVHGDRPAEEALALHGGGLDGFEYRFTGTTGMLLGSWLTRAIGWLAFSYFEWRLQFEARRR